MSCPSIPSSPTLATYFEKGCVYWFDLDGNTDPKISSKKARPYMVISRLNTGSNRVIISPISDKEHYIEKDGTGKLKYPYHAELSKKGYSFLDKDSVVLLDQVYTVPKSEFIKEWYMGLVIDMSTVDTAMFYNYDLFEAINQCFQNAVSNMQSEHIKNYSRK